MRLPILISAAFSVVLLTNCAKNETGANAPRATVQLRDGTAVAGKVLSTSATEIKVAGDDNITRTIPMTQVRSVDYGDAPAVAAAPATGTAPPAPATSTVPATGGAAAPVPAEPGAPTKQAAAEPPEPPHESHPRPSAKAVTTKTYELPAGTRISVRNEETIDSGKAVEGQTFAADVARDVRDAAGDIVIPRGANAKIIIRSASKGGKFKGKSDLVLDLDSVSIEGKMYRLGTKDMVQRGRDGVGANKRTVEFAGGGAAVGAIIGAIAGGGKGAAIGAGSGAGAGAATEILTKGGSVKVPAETVLTFQLDRPLRVVEAQ